MVQWGGQHESSKIFRGCHCNCAHKYAYRCNREWGKENRGHSSRPCTMVVNVAAAVVAAVAAADADAAVLDIDK